MNLSLSSSSGAELEASSWDQASLVEESVEIVNTGDKTMTTNQTTHQDDVLVAFLAIAGFGLPAEYMGHFVAGDAQVSREDADDNALEMLEQKLGEDIERRAIRERAETWTADLCAGLRDSVTHDGEPVWKLIVSMFGDDGRAELMTSDEGKNVLEAILGEAWETQSDTLDNRSLVRECYERSECAPLTRLVGLESIDSLHIEGEWLNVVEALVGETWELDAEQSEAMSAPRVMTPEEARERRAAVVECYRAITHSLMLMLGSDAVADLRMSGDYVPSLEALVGETWEGVESAHDEALADASGYCI